MEEKHIILLFIGIPVLTGLIIFLLLDHFCKEKVSEDVEAKAAEGGDNSKKEELIKFNGGEDLSLNDILEAPGEVIAKSSYGTLYKACLVKTNSLAFLRFLRPTCTLKIKEVMEVIELLGSVRHVNLVPLYAFYAGDKGEKLMIHPFVSHGTLARLIKDGNSEVHKWLNIHKISIGIARAVDYLHNSKEEPIIHGNLKSKNILIDRNYQPYVSNFGLHLLLNTSSRQKILETSDVQGYKAPELIKMEYVSERCDIYSLGVIFIELITEKEPIELLAIRDHRIEDLCRPEIPFDDQKDCVFKYFELALACCNPVASQRPDIKQVLSRLEDIER